MFYLEGRKEEQASIEKFGDAYKTYMEKVARMNTIVGIVRLLRLKKK